MPNRLLGPCLALAALAGCYNPAIPSGSQACAEGAVCASGYTCGPDNRCHKNGGGEDLAAACTAQSCKGTATPVCDPVSLRCVVCASDQDCPSGQLCTQNACSPGCSAAHGCPDGGGTCDTAGKMCKVCGGDGDCSGATPRCDLNARACVACLPQNDNCTAGTFCTQVNGVYECAKGCKVDKDCAANGDGGASPMTCCNHLCTNTLVDGKNCGVCGTDCGGKACCSGACFDTTNSLANCGACGKACSGDNATWTCAGSKCGVASCNRGFADCNAMASDGCEVNLATDSQNCGVCKMACAAMNASAVCLNAACTIGMCNAGTADCNMAFDDGCEVDLTKDVNNCGGCAKPCKLANATPACNGGACAIQACTKPFVDCNVKPDDGCEVNINEDVGNCGGCTKKCAAIANGTVACAAGACAVGSCAAGFADCDALEANGCEINTTNDVKHCGGCKTGCPLGPNVAAVACGMSVCAITACQPGFSDCNHNFADGCEANLAIDNKNCGACGSVCNGPLPCGNFVCPAVYSEVFTLNTPDVAQCNDWNNFVAALGKGYTSMTLSGTFDIVGVTCNDPTVVANIVANFKAGLAGSYFAACNGSNWAVCGMYNDSLWVGAPMLCDGADCPSPGYFLRPCLAGGNSSNWGGVNTATCGGPTQTITLVVQ